MSGNLKLKGATSGSSQLSAPDTGTDQQFTFPAAGGELAVSGPKKAFFYARPSQNRYLREADGAATLTYDVVDQNVGNAYSASTFRFTAPQDGFYQFNAQFFGGNGTTSSERGAADLIITNHPQNPRFGRENDATGFMCVGVSWSGFMSAGDQAYLRRFTGVLHTAAGFSFFSGYLIS